MSFFGRIILCFLTAAFLTAVNGCSPGDSGQIDEEKEPHFLLGNSRCNEMDWNGAVEAFEDSLEVNPHSAEAHYRLAQLFDTKVPDPAAAIYHYQEYLKLEPDAKNRDVISQRIDSCKQQLATDVLQLPSAPAVQKQLDSLVEQNRQLQATVDTLNAQLRDWNAYYASLKQAGNAGTVPAVQPATTSVTPDDISSQPSQPQPQTQPTLTVVNKAKPALTRAERSHTHIVASGETMASIARKHGLSLSALEDANPSVNPKKLHVGQLIILPP
ncbi:MAG: LysM peptidoglycan-binding domain-containing protein [Verrucomicrobiota bacterium]|jgi:LysM repeat protein